MMVCRHKAAKHYPAEHRRKNEPKLSVNNSIDSHVTLHGRPWGLNFQPLRKLPGTWLMRCRRAGHRFGAELAPNAVVVNATAAANGKLAAPGSRRNAATLHLSG